MMKEANIVQLYSPDGTEAYPITSEHLVRDDNGNEIIGILREETSSLKEGISKLETTTDELNTTSDDIILMMADLIGGEEK